MVRLGTKIADYANVVSGYAFKSQDFVDKGIPVLKIANIQHEHVIFEKIQYLSVEFRNVPKRYHVLKGDVLISLTGSHISQPNSVVGRVARYRHDVEALLNQRAGRIVIRDSDSLNQGFLYYFLRQEKITYQLAINASGSANQANISPRDVEAIPLPDFAIAEQRRIASILSAYDDLIENNRRRIALLEEAARQLYKEWFVRFRFPGHEHINIINGVPEGWSRKALGDLAYLVMGQSPKSQFYNQDGNGLPFHQGVTDYGFRYVSHRSYSTAVTKLAEPNDILVSVRAPVGRINITLDRIVLGRGLSAIRSKSENQSFLFYALKEHFYAEDIIGTGAIYAATNKKEMEAQLLLMPSENLITDFEDVCAPIDRQIANLTRLIHRRHGMGLADVA